SRAPSAATATAPTCTWTGLRSRWWPPGPSAPSWPTSRPPSPRPPGCRAAAGSRSRDRNRCCPRTQGGAALQVLDGLQDLLHRLLGVAEQKRRVLLVEERV